MMIDKTLVILNPIAGKGSAGKRRNEVEDLLHAYRVSYDLVLTEAVGHAQELARDAGRKVYDAVVAAGGDGTMNEVINGLMAAQGQGATLPVLGALAMGRGNDFSYGAAIPSVLEDGVAIIAAGKTCPMDVGFIQGGDYPEGRYFGNGVGIGFDTIVGLEAAKMKHVHGFMAYVLGALKTFIAYPDAVQVHLEYDEGVIEQESHQISIMNGKRMGGTFYMAPEASNSDGLLDFCMAGRLTRGNMAQAILGYIKGTQGDLPFFTTGRSRHYTVTAPLGGLVVHADGETICTKGTEVSVHCLPGKIRILCPWRN